MTQKLLTTLIFLLFFSLFLLPMKDTDFGWHLRCGQEIFENGRLCQTNHFTTLLDGYHWYSPAQGYQILLFLTFKYFGFAGIAFLYALTAGAVFTFFIKSLGRGPVISTVVTLTGVWFAWSTLNIGFRSQILSVYFILIFLGIVRLSQKQPRIIYGLPVMMIIWSNSHSGFFLGLVISLFLFLDTFVKYILKKSSRKYFLVVTLTSGLNLVASLVNPYGFQIYQEVFRHSRVALNTLIAEWVPPQAWQIFLAISVCVWLGNLSWRRKDFFSIFLLAFSTYLAIFARRNLPIFSLAAVYAALNNLSQNFDETTIKKSIQKVWLVIMLLAISLLTYKNLPLALDFNEKTYCQKALVVMPCLGAKFMMSQKPGRIFNTYEWGGYLIWSLPQFKIFVDGRMPSWDTSKERTLPDSWQGKSPYTIYIETIQAQTGWEEILKNYQTEYVMIQNGAYLDSVLKENQIKYGFENIYRDDYTSIYRKINLGS